MDELPTIPEFYSGKNIFITGGSGFIGKVLVEKLLRSCPKLKNIYLLMREKKGKSTQERLKAITDLPLFDVLKYQQPQAINKIKIVDGDVTQLDLGLSEEDKSLLIDQVNIIFHGAASVRFDDALTDAIILNTRGAREVVNLALKMKNLYVLNHISTTYCHTDRKVIGEELYPAHADWKKTIEIAENIDRHTLNLATAKYINPLPNTYTFTKSLAEHVVYDLTNGKIPAVIFRPSIVISTAREPMPGWIDNFNGPVGLLLACGKGIICTAYSDPDLISDYVPVDVVVKALIMAAWKQANHKDINQKLTPAIYNGSNDDIRPVTMGEIVNMGPTICSEIPLNNVLWYPNAKVTACFYNYFIKVIIYHLIPAIFIDGLLKILGRKPLLMKIQRRVYVANTALQYFTLNQWKFINDNTVELQNLLLPNDVDAFSYREDELEVLEYFKNSTKGARMYLLNEGDDLEPAKKHSQRMWYLAQVCNVLWYLGLIWLFFVKIDVISLVIDRWNNFYEYLITE